MTSSACTAAYPDPSRASRRASRPSWPCPSSRASTRRTSSRPPRRTRWPPTASGPTPPPKIKKMI
eukprot:2307647-Prorocentrum_lima.AAC.1